MNKNEHYLDFNLLELEKTYANYLQPYIGCALLCNYRYGKICLDAFHANGTVGFIQTEKHRFIITANHVYEEYERLLEKKYKCTINYL